MPLLFAPNLSMLWPDQPFGERFGRAARAGFRAVELWWPGEAPAAALPGLLSRWDLRLALLNFDGGDLAAGERGLAADPAVGLEYQPSAGTDASFGWLTEYRRRP